MKIEQISNDGQSIIVSETENGPCHLINLNDISRLLSKLNLQYMDKEVLIFPECLRGQTF